MRVRYCPHQRRFDRGWPERPPPRRTIRDCCAPLWDWVLDGLVLCALPLLLALALLGWLADPPARRDDWPD
jgi:hypothetical protein